MPPSAVELTAAPQLLGDGDRVDRLTPAVQQERGVEDHAVRGLVEVAGLDVRLDRGGDRLAGEHHRPEQRLLGLEVVRRDRERRRDRASAVVWFRACALALSSD